MNLKGVRRLEGQPAVSIDGVVYVYVGNDEWSEYDDHSGSFGYASPIEGEALTKLMQQEDAWRKQWDQEKAGKG